MLKTRIFFLLFVFTIFDGVIFSQSLAYKLAVIERNSFVDKDDLLVKRFNNLLNQLENKYMDSQQRISDATVAAKESLEKGGIKESMITLMEGMNTIYDPSNKSKKYHEYLGSYLIIRLQGRTHKETLLIFQQLLNEVGIKGILNAMGVE
jgi:hypothetical protein